MGAVGARSGRGRGGEKRCFVAAAGSSSREPLSSAPVRASRASFRDAAGAPNSSRHGGLPAGLEEARAQGLANEP